MTYIIQKNNKAFSLCKYLAADMLQVCMKFVFYLVLNLTENIAETNMAFQFYFLQFMHNRVKEFATLLLFCFCVIITPTFFRSLNIIQRQHE